MVVGIFWDAVTQHHRQEEGKARDDGVGLHRH